jgi:hypothetical protein
MMKPITIERLSTADAINQSGQRIGHDWGKLPYNLPVEYKEFLELFNGYCGSLGTSYVVLLPFEGLAEANESYEMEKYWQGMAMIGSDGGGMGYAVNQAGQFLTFDFTGDYEEVLADDFDGFIDCLYNYDWGDEDA